MAGCRSQCTANKQHCPQHTGTMQMPVSPKDRVSFRPGCRRYRGSWCLVTVLCSREITKPIRAHWGGVGPTKPRSCQGWSVWLKDTLRVPQDYLSPADALSVPFAMSQSPSLLSLPVPFPVPSTNPSSALGTESTPWSICHFMLPTFRRCSRCSSQPALIRSPFGVCWHVLVFKQLHIKLEGLKSRSRLTSAVAPSCNQPAASHRAKAVVFAPLFVGLTHLLLLFPLVRVWVMVTQSLRKA